MSSRPRVERGGNHIRLTLPNATSAHASLLFCIFNCRAATLNRASRGGDKERGMERLENLVVETLDIVETERKVSFSQIQIKDGNARRRARARATLPVLCCDTR